MTVVANGLPMLLPPSVADGTSASANAADGASPFAGLLAMLAPAEPDGPAPNGHPPLPSPDSETGSDLTLVPIDPNTPMPVFVPPERNPQFSLVPIADEPAPIEAPGDFRVALPIGEKPDPVVLPKPIHILPIGGQPAPIVSPPDSIHILPIENAPVPVSGPVANTDTDESVPAEKPGIVTDNPAYAMVSIAMTAAPLAALVVPDIAYGNETPAAAPATTGPAPATTGPAPARARMPLATPAVPNAPASAAATVAAVATPDAAPKMTVRIVPAANADVPNDKAVRQAPTAPPNGQANSISATPGSAPGDTRSTSAARPAHIEATPTTQASADPKVVTLAAAWKSIPSAMASVAASVRAAIAAPPPRNVPAAPVKAQPIARVEVTNAPAAVPVSARVSAVANAMAAAAKPAPVAVEPVIAATGPEPIARAVAPVAAAASSPESAALTEPVIAARQEAASTPVVPAAAATAIVARSAAMPAPALAAPGEPLPVAANSETIAVNETDSKPGHGEPTLRATPAVSVDPAPATAPAQVQAATPPALTVPQQIAAERTETPLRLAARETAARDDAPETAALALRIAAKSAQGARRFDIRLDPPELGRIDVRLEVNHQGRAEAQLSADKPQTLDLLQRDHRALERALKDAGLDLGSMSFSLKGDERRAPAQHVPHESGGRAAAIAPTAAAPAQAARWRSNPDARVDIRV